MASIFSEDVQVGTTVNERIVRKKTRQDKTKIVLYSNSSSSAPDFSGIHKKNIEFIINKIEISHIFS